MNKWDHDNASFFAQCNMHEKLTSNDLSPKWKPLSNLIDRKADSGFVYSQNPKARCNKKN